MIVKSTTIVDRNGVAVRAMRTTDNDLSGRPALVLDLSEQNQKSIAAVVTVEDARHLGEWLIAWAKEHEK